MGVRGENDTRQRKKERGRRRENDTKQRKKGRGGKKERSRRERGARNNDNRFVFEVKDSELEKIT